jgi:hypothetical protein
MKKILLSLLVLGTMYGTSNAQGMLEKAKAAATLTGLDVKSLSNNIMSQLTPKLKLNPQQVTNVASLVGTFLNKKSGIMGLMQSNPKAYATQQSDLFNNLTKGLGGVLAANQMKQFMGLKPASNDAKNPLSMLFY